MIAAIEDARIAGADLVVFGELSVCGYPPRDFLEFNDFISRCEGVVADLLPYSHHLGIILGAPAKNPKLEGKDLFNSAYFLADGKIQGITHKTLLPTYDIFDEYRYFEMNTQFSLISFKGYKIALSVCEDIWNVGNENPLYPICPLDEVAASEPDFIINISASPFHYAHAQNRIHTVRANATRYGVPVFYVNHVGVQTELIFDGGSLAVAASGKVVREMPYFSEALEVFDTGHLENQMKGEQPKEKFALIHQAIVCGIRDYFGKLGFNKAILGLSGGIDSALTLALAIDALGPDNVLSVLMPSRYSSDHSVNDSLTLCNNLGSPHKIISIEDPFQATLQLLTPHFKDKAPDVTEENLQARIRANILMALSNKHGYILLNTSNKSEVAVGYGTLYGDMCGGLAVLGDIYKTEVYPLARYMNREREIIPEHIFTKAPSAELRPGQKDSDSLPSYDVLDQVLYQYIENRRGPRELVEMGFEKPLVDRVLKLVNMNEYKRHQTPPILRISHKAFGSGRRMPIVGKYLI